MAARDEMNAILAGIDQSTLTDEEFEGVSLPETPIRFDYYSALIPILSLRDGVSDSLPRLKSYAHAVDSLLINVNTNELEAAQRVTNVLIGRPLE